MKVLIISSSDSGGAGIAALRLHKALLASGVHSSMLCIRKTTETEGVYEYHRSLWSKVLSHLPIPYRQNKYKKYQKVLSKLYGCYSFPEAIYDISDDPLVKDADIINLHWVGNILNYPLFFKKVQKPIVWTLHDRNPFWGIAHYGGDRITNIQFQFLENKVTALKSKAIHQNKNITIVCLSNWMREQSSVSETFKPYEHKIIPNSIDTSIFCLQNQQEIRVELGIPNDMPVFIFVSQHVQNYWKGFDILLESMKLQHYDCFYLVVGERSDELSSYTNIKFFGTIKDELLMAKVYSAADAFLLPTREDNFPNTMVESLCCGTPVITFTNGGMRDCIQNGKNGMLVESMDASHFAKAVDYFIENKDSFDRNLISKEGIANFNPSVQAERYCKVYSNILENGKTINNNH